VRKAGDHPAQESLKWIARLRAMVEERPEKFSKVVTTAEKKMLEQLLKRALRVTRRQTPPRTTAIKRRVPTKKKAARTST